jgi:hypothetical protein
MNKLICCLAMLVVAAPAFADEAVIKAASNIEERQPVGEASVFKKGERVYVWSHIKGADGKNVDHVWKRNGAEFYRAHFEIASSSFRVFSRTSGAAAGSYEVDVMCGDNKLGTATFTVEQSGNRRADAHDVGCADAEVRRAGLVIA